MRTIVSNHDKEKLAKKIFKMVEQGWEPKSKITYQDGGIRVGAGTYFCVMQLNNEVSK